MNTNDFNGHAGNHATRFQHSPNIERETSEPGCAVSRDDIATRAYYRYKINGSQSGYADRDWLDAEAEIRTDRRLSEAFDIGKIA